MDEKLDVLIVTQFFPPESMGGAHRWEKLAANLDEDIEPHVLTTQPTFPFGEFERRWRFFGRETLNGVPVTRLFTHQPTSDTAMGRVLNYGVFSVLSALYVLVNFWRYDCIVTMSAPHTTFLSGLVGKATGRTWIIDIFDLWIDNATDLGYVERESVTYRLVSWLELTAINSADCVFVITETMVEFYENKYPSLDFAIEVIPFGVDTDLFNPEVDSIASTDLIYTGNLGSGQAFVPFFEALAQFDGEYELTIAGDGERRDELEDLVNDLDLIDAVTFLGHIPRDDIPGRLAGATVSLVPLKTSYQLDYARPTKMLESMAVGTPYIASAVKEISELSDTSGPGITVENHPDEISGEIESMLNCSHDLEGMGKNGVEVVKTGHDWDIIGRKAADIIKNESGCK